MASSPEECCSLGGRTAAFTFEGAIEHTRLFYYRFLSPIGAPCTTCQARPSSTAAVESEDGDDESVSSSGEQAQAPTIWISSSPIHNQFVPLHQRTQLVYNRHHHRRNHLNHNHHNHHHHRKRHRKHFVARGRDKEGGGGLGCEAQQPNLIHPPSSPPLEPLALQSSPGSSETNPPELPPATGITHPSIHNLLFKTW